MEWVLCHQSKLETRPQVYSTYHDYVRNSLLELNEMNDYFMYMISICWCPASSNLNIRHQWSCGFCNSSIDIQKFTLNEFEYDCFQWFLSFFPVIHLMLLVLYVCLQGNPMFVTTVTVGNLRASCYPQPNQFAAVDIASYQLIQGIQKQGPYQIPPAVPSNQPQNSATETSSGMRHSCDIFAIYAYFWFTLGEISHTLSQYLHA